MGLGQVTDTLQLIDIQITAQDLSDDGKTQRFSGCAVFAFGQAGTPESPGGGMKLTGAFANQVNLQKGLEQALHDLQTHLERLQEAVRVFRDPGAP